MRLLDSSLSWWRFVGIIIFALLTSVFNAAVLWAELQTNRSHKQYPVISLLTADMLLGLAVYPFAMVINIIKPPRIWCIIWHAVDGVCCSASILSILFIGFERHEAVKNPFDARSQGKIYRKAVAGVWLAAVVCSVTSTWFSFIEGLCNGEQNAILAIAYSTGIFYVPAICMIFYNVRVILAIAAAREDLPLRRHRGRMPQVGEDIQLSRTSSRTDDVDQNITHDYCNCSRSTIRIMVHMFTFLICWTPYFVLYPLNSLLNNIKESVLETSIWLTFLHSILSPIVYAINSEAIRTNLRKMFIRTSRTTDLEMATMGRG